MDIRSWWPVSAAIHSDDDAFNWLLKNGYPEFAVLCNAINNEPHAIQWLVDHKAHLLSLFAAACRKDDDAIRWFADNKLDVFLFLVRTIHKELLFQAWDANDPHRW